MEPRFWSKDFVSNSRLVFRVLKKAKDEIYFRGSSSQTRTNNFQLESDQFSHDQDKWQKKKLQEQDKKSHPIRDKHRNERRKKVRNVLSALSLDSHVRKTVRFASGRVIISSLLYKTYLKLKDKNLIQVHPELSDLNIRCKVERADGSRSQFPSYHGLVNCDISIDNVERSAWSEKKQKEKEDKKLPNSNLELKRKMYEKYQNPSKEKVKELKEMFSEPDKLFHKVMSPVWEAGLPCYQPLTVSTHMKGLYWKAKIQLLWPRKVTVTGTHISKENAVASAYLLACDQLKDLGLIAVGSGHSSPSLPVNCDTVIRILEEMSHYSHSTLSGSKGKGFKIVLERVKSSPDPLEDEHICYNRLDGKVCSEWQTVTTKYDVWSKWSCCVHVGWPVPFSVQMVAPSLPSAQMLALLTVASNLKLTGMLNKTNEELNSLALQNAVLRDTSSEWQKRVHFFQDSTPIQECDASADVDAILHVDASHFGYGAYLKLKDSDKVNWLSENWLHQPHVFSELHQYYNQQFIFHSSIAELFALVSTVFSWKRKLQYRKLLCYNDNQIAISLISTLQFNQLSSSSQYVSAYDFLMDTLQETCNTYNIQLCPFWVQRQHNWLADRLANGDIQTFRAAVPNAMTRKTKVKHLQLKQGFLSGDRMISSDLF